jgi:acetylornithine/succinyldiaminopimelate/putrescine aminotransferase
MPEMTEKEKKIASNARQMGNAFEHATMQFQAKKNCKSCRGRGFLTRTFPLGKDEEGNKQMAVNKTLCHCATEIIKLEPDKEKTVNTPSPDECFVPKVSQEVKQYASKAVPSF